MQRNLPKNDISQGDSDQLKKLKSIFLSSLNHEIRTPLNGIFGLTDLLLETEMVSEQREYVESVRACADTLFEMLNAMLEYSALSAGNAHVDEGEFLIEDTLRSVAVEYALKADFKGLRLTLQCDNSLPEAVIGDARRIRQILIHLLSNAVKFTAHGTIAIDVSAKASNSASVLLKVAVRDTGIGIDQAHQAIIIDAFHQLDSGLAREYAGIGLGLAICQKQVHLLGGHLELESTVGVGSTFSFTIPLTLPVWEMDVIV